jgi:Xaa-Pro aminopeptidase
VATANPVPERLLQFLASGWADHERHTPEADPRVGAWADRRRRLAESFPDQTLVIRAGHEVVRNATTTYSFRAHSDFVYLCGAAEPDAVLVIHPGGESELFAHTPHPRGAVEWFTDASRSPLWSGPQPEPDELAVRFGVAVRPLEQLPPEYRSASQEPALEGEISRAAARLRLFKDPFEIASLRSAAAASLLGHEELRAEIPHAIQDGGERWLEGTFLRRCSASGNGPGYWPIVGAGAHSCILHWHRNDGPVREGDVVLVDAAVEGLDHYTADITRTYPTGDAFTPTQQAVVDIVQAAHDAAIASIRPGTGFHDSQDIAWGVLVDGLIDLGVFTSEQRAEALDPETMLHRRYTLHRTSHMLGLDVHDCQVINAEYRAGSVQPGMVFTIEPGLYLQENDHTVPASLRGIGVRIEDDVLCTDDGAVVLSAAV